MRGIRSRTLVATAGACWLVVSCSDSREPPTAMNPPTPAAGLLAEVSAAETTPFTFRAPLDHYKILQLPDFMMQSRTRSDIVFQRNVFAPGPGGWHIHSGPSFVYVIQGQIKLTEYSDKDGCTDTAVHGPGDAYFEEGNHVHRAVVVSSESVVLLVTRFNIPVGGAITVPMPDPGC